MDVFDLRQRLVNDYARYTRSFIKIAGAPVVREMFGLMTAEKGRPSHHRHHRKLHPRRPGVRRRQTRPLINGPQLLALLQSVQTRPAVTENQTTPPPTYSTAPDCPLCGKPMVQEKPKARRGSNAATRFGVVPPIPRAKARGTKPDSRNVGYRFQTDRASKRQPNRRIRRALLSTRTASLPDKCHF